MGIILAAKTELNGKQKRGSGWGHDQPPLLHFLFVRRRGYGGIAKGGKGGGANRNPFPPLQERAGELLESWNVENPVFNHFKLFNDGPEPQTENSGAGCPAPTVNPLRPFLERRSGREKILHARKGDSLRKGLFSPADFPVHPNTTAGRKGKAREKAKGFRTKAKELE